MMDFSSILSSSTLVDSTAIELSNTRCRLDDIDLNLVNYLNKELDELGFESIYSQSQSNHYHQNSHQNSHQSTSHFSSLSLSSLNNDQSDRSNATTAPTKTYNYNLLFANCVELCKRYSRQTETLSRSQDKCFQLDRENELMLKRQNALRSSNEQAQRDLATCDEKRRQAQVKHSQLTKQLKELDSEQRKLSTILENRDKQFKHERKKYEKELDRMKERVKTITTGKAKELSLPRMDLSESIINQKSYSSSSSSSRATWNVETLTSPNKMSKKQMDLYTELVKDYDRKNKELIVETVDFRTFLSSLYSSLSSVCKQLNNNNNHENNNNNNNNSSNCSNCSSSSSSCSSSSNDSSNSITIENSSQSQQDYNVKAIVELPFENIQSELNKIFQQKVNQLREFVVATSKSKKTNHNNNTTNNNKSNSNDEEDENETASNSISSD